VTQRRALVETHLHIPRQVAERYARPPVVEREDLEQVGREELVKAAEEWPRRGMFALYAWTRVRRAAIDELRRLYGTDGAKLHAAKTALQIETAHKNLEKNRHNAFEQAASRALSYTDDDTVESRRTLGMVRRLPPDQRFVVLGRGYGYSMREIVACSGRSDSYWRQVERDAHRQLRMWC
jgi:RNA polymerase sigma factor (sigma-70 family)